MRLEARGLSKNAARKTGALVLLNLALLVLPWASSAQTDWKKRWDATVEAGRKEGEVVIYGPHNPAYQQIWAIFQKILSRGEV